MIHTDDADGEGGGGGDDAAAGAPRTNSSDQLLIFADAVAYHGALLRRNRAWMTPLPASPLSPTYAHVCSRMLTILTYAHGSSRIITYAHICSHMLTYAHVW